MITQILIISRKSLHLRQLIRLGICLGFVVFCSVFGWSQSGDKALMVKDTLLADTLVYRSLSNEDLETDTESEDYLVVYRHYITSSLSAILNYTPGIQFGYEYSLSNRLAVVADAGYLISATQPRTGYRLKAELRYYLKDDNFFFGLEGVRKQTITDATNWFDLGTHQQRLDYKGIRLLNYLGLKGGVIFDLSQSDWLQFEIAGSIGGGEYSVSTSGLPSDATLATDGFALFGNPNRFVDAKSGLPIASISVKIKFGIGATLN